MAGTSPDRSKTVRGGDDVWEDLVLALLSVNQYSLEKTYSSYESLKKHGLFDPENLARWEVDEICDTLCRAGCNRGPFMSKLFAVRLACLGDFIVAQGVEKCVETLQNKNVEEIERLLIRVKGIGPRVLANFFLLQGIEAAPKNRSI